MKGGDTNATLYLKNHQDLVPAKRQVVESQGSRSQRYHTNHGEAYQMDWGFVEVDTEMEALWFEMIEQARQELEDEAVKEMVNMKRWEK